MSSDRIRTSSYGTWQGGLPIHLFIRSLDQSHRCVYWHAAVEVNALMLKLLDAVNTFKLRRHTKFGDDIEKCYLTDIIILYFLYRFAWRNDSCIWPLLFLLMQENWWNLSVFLTSRKHFQETRQPRIANVAPTNNSQTEAGEEEFLRTNIKPSDICHNRKCR